MGVGKERKTKRSMATGGLLFKLPLSLPPVVTKAYHYPKFRVDLDLNKNGVECSVLHDGKVVRINVHCGATFATKLDAAREVKSRLIGIVGEAAVIAAEQLVAARAVAVHPPSSAAASSSSAAPQFAVLGETQRLKSVLRAAELRAASAEKVSREADRIVSESEAACMLAYASVEEAKAALARHGKRQRVEEEAQQGQVMQVYSLIHSLPHSCTPLNAT